MFRTLMTLAALGLFLPAIPAQAATMVDASFRFDLYGDDGGDAAPLLVTLSFALDDALLDADGETILFPADGGEGIDLVTSYAFEGGGLSSAMIAGRPDRVRSVFFDMAASGGSIFDPDAALSGIALFSDYATDEGGCLLGMAGRLFGLGADAAGGCRVLTYAPVIGGDSGTAVFRLADGTGAVPEPGAWLLMIGGFAVVGTALRQARVRRTAG